MMLRFLVARTCLLVVLVLAASAAMMAVASLTPGDATTELTGTGADPQALARERERLCLDCPAGERYGRWLARAIRLDFGSSFRYHEPVTPLVAARTLNSLVLALTALALATLVALPAGVLAGSGRFPRLSGAIAGVSLILLSCPPLLMALLLTYAAARTGWVPIGGMTGSAAEGLPVAARLADAASHLVVPVLALALPLAATLERIQAAAVADGRGARHVVAAFARGLTVRRVLWRDLWRPTAAPVAAVYGLAAGSLLSGALAVELVTAWPGVGRLMFEALGWRDVPLAAGCAAAAAAFLAVWTTISDLIGWWLDPRTRPGAAS